MSLRSSQSTLSGIGPCDLVISKVKYDQVGADDGSKEGVEIRARAAPAGATYESCGVTTISLYEGSTCEREAANRSIEIGALTVPASGVAVFSRTGATLGAQALAEAPLSSGSWLENGPDFIALENQGQIVSLLSIPGAQGQATCTPQGFSGEITALPELAETTTNEHVLVLCDQGFVKVEQSSAPWLQDNPCPSEVDAGVNDAASADAHDPDAESSDAEGSDAQPQDASTTPDAETVILTLTITITSHSDINLCP
ncbi:MAG: hypothetical protein U0165_02915 [Polyangiaceae bacterium]